MAFIYVPCIHCQWFLQNCNQKNVSVQKRRSFSKIMSQSLFSRYSSFLRLRLWLLGNELPARISSAFTAIPLPTIKGYLDNQSANSSRHCLLVGAMKDYMSPWLAVHLTPQGSGPIGTHKSGGAISMAKEGLYVMQRQGAVRGRWGGQRAYICVYVSMLAVCVTQQ